MSGDTVDEGGMNETVYKTPIAVEVGRDDDSDVGKDEVIDEDNVEAYKTPSPAVPLHHNVGHGELVSDVTQASPFKKQIVDDSVRSDIRMEVIMREENEDDQDKYGNDEVPSLGPKVLGDITMEEMTPLSDALYLEQTIGELTLAVPLAFGPSDHTPRENNSSPTPSVVPSVAPSVSCCTYRSYCSFSSQRRTNLYVQ